jgi:hypothetical protein
MNIYIPSRGVSDWRHLLADPNKHWVTGYSARTMAHCWEASNGFPPEVSHVLSQCAEFADIEPLFIVPERKVALDNDRAPSQNDAWVLAKAASGLVSIAVEGKVNEPFDVTLGEWKETESKGRVSRLEFLAKTLALTGPVPDSIRYQLLHRTASAVIEARRFGATHAVMLVHSFSKDNLWFDDFAAFCELFGLLPSVGQLVTASAFGNIPLHLGWVHGDERFLVQCSCCPAASEGAAHG